MFWSHGMIRIISRPWLVLYAQRQEIECLYRPIKLFPEISHINIGIIIKINVKNKIMVMTWNLSNLYSWLGYFARAFCLLHVNHGQQGFDLLQWNPQLMTTPLIGLPCYYDHFFSGQSKSSVIFLFKGHPVNMPRFFWPVSDQINRVPLYFKGL